MSEAPALILPDKTRSIGHDLRRTLGADKVKDDFPTITAYSVDASIYKVVPKAVVTAETEDDIVATVAYAVSAGVPITPRAAGTNLPGSAGRGGGIPHCGPGKPHPPPDGPGGRGGGLPPPRPHRVQQAARRPAAPVPGR